MRKHRTHSSTPGQPTPSRSDGFETQAAEYEGSGSRPRGDRVGPESIGSGQPFWGRQITQLGLGSDLPFRKLNGARLHNALIRALEPDVRDNAKLYVDVLATENGVSGAADALIRA